MAAEPLDYETWLWRQVRKDATDRGGNLLGKLPREIFAELVKFCMMVRWMDAMSQYEVMRTFVGHGKDARNVAFLNSNEIVSVGWDRIIRVWDVEKAEIVREVDMSESKLFSSSFKAERWDDHRLLLGGGSSVAAVDTRTSAIVVKITDVPAEVNYTHWSERHGLVLVLSRSGVDHLLAYSEYEAREAAREGSATSPKPRYTIRSSVADDKDFQYMYPCDDDILLACTRRVRIHHVLSGELVRVLQLPGCTAPASPFGCAFSNRNVVMAGEGPRIHLWDHASGDYVGVYDFSESGGPGVEGLRIMGSSLGVILGGKGLRFMRLRRASALVAQRDLDLLRLLPEDRSAAMRTMRINPDNFAVVQGLSDTTMRLLKLY